MYYYVKNIVYNTLKFLLYLGNIYLISASSSALISNLTLGSITLDCLLLFFGASLSSISIGGFSDFSSSG